MLLLVSPCGNSASIRLIDSGNSATLASLFNFFWLITYLKRLCPLPNRILLGTILISSPLSCRCYCLNQIINDMVICFKWLSLHFWGTQTTIGDAIRSALWVYALLWTMPMHIGILSPMICHKLFHMYMQCCSKFCRAVDNVCKEILLQTPTFISLQDIEEKEIQGDPSGW